jgi:hypothetical protein
MADNASRVFAAAQSLAHLLLSELEALPAVRVDGFAERQRFTLTASVAGAVVGVVMLGLLLMPRRQAAARRGRHEEPTTGARGFAVVEDPGSRRVGHAR